MKLTHLHQVAVYARDLDEAAAFYRDTLGAKFLAKFDPPGLVFFEFSGTRILLQKSGPKATLYFRVDDIHAAYEDLKARGVAFAQPPGLIHQDDEGTFGKPGNEEWMAFFSDPSGNSLALAAQK